MDLLHPTGEIEIIKDGILMVMWKEKFWVLLVFLVILWNKSSSLKCKECRSADDCAREFREEECNLTTYHSESGTQSAVCGIVVQSGRITQAGCGPDIGGQVDKFQDKPDDTKLLICKTDLCNTEQKAIDQKVVSNPGSRLKGAGPSSIIPTPTHLQHILIASGISIAFCWNLNV